MQNHQLKTYEKWASSQKSNYPWRRRRSARASINVNKFFFDHWPSCVVVTVETGLRYLNISVPHGGRHWYLRMFISNQPVESFMYCLTSGKAGDINDAADVKLAVISTLEQKGKMRILWGWRGKECYWHVGRSEIDGRDDGAHSDQPTVRDLPSAPRPPTTPHHVDYSSFTLLLTTRRIYFV